MSLTIYTPTYNRSFSLPQVYESLLRQTVKDFTWLIVDDGSTDNTQDLVEQWIENKRLDIRYLHQENRGMLGAHNTAHKNIETVLCVCIDSDDFMPDNGVEIIMTNWEPYKSDPSIAGMVGLDCYKNGKVIGNSFENSGVKTTYRQAAKTGGDKKYVYRTAVLKEFGPYPEVPGEKFPAQGYLYRLIDTKYRLIAINEILCVVEYLTDGNSFNKMSSYMKNPQGFMLHRLLLMELAMSFAEKFRNAVHFVSSCLFARRWEAIFTNRFRLVTILAAPFGFLLYFYIRFNKKKPVNKQLNKGL